MDSEFLTMLISFFESLIYPLNFQSISVIPDTTSHHLQHHFATQAEAVLKQQALGHNLIFPDAICILGKQFLVLLAGRNIIFRWFDVAIPEFFQNIHNITLLKSVCDVTSAAHELQVAKLHKPGRLFLLQSVV